MLTTGATGRTSPERERKLFVFGCMLRQLHAPQRHRLPVDHVLLLCLWRGVTEGIRIVWHMGWLMKLREKPLPSG